MSDYYPATLTIHRWPGVENASADVVAALEAAGFPLEENGTFHADEVVLREAQDDTTSLTLTDDQARFGTNQLHGRDDTRHATGLELALQTAGLPYELRDEGAYEWPGVLIDWAPGMDEPRERTNSPAGAVLTEGEYRTTLNEHQGDPLGLAAAIATHFSPLPGVAPLRPNRTPTAVTRCS